jgi:hypothetical protein
MLPPRRAQGRRPAVRVPGHDGHGLARRPPVIGHCGTVTVTRTRTRRRRHITAQGRRTRMLYHWQPECRSATFWPGSAAEWLVAPGPGRVRRGVTGRRLRQLGAGPSPPGRPGDRDRDRRLRPAPAGGRPARVMIKPEAACQWHWQCRLRGRRGRGGDRHGCDGSLSDRAACGLGLGPRPRGGPD